MKKWISNLQRFSDGAGAGGTGDTGSGNAGAGGAGADGNGGGSGGTGGQSQPFAVFPDEQSFMARITREGKKHVGEFLKGLGVDEEGLKTILKTHTETLEKNKTDLEKANEAKTAAEKQVQTVLEKLNNTVRTSEARLLAVELGVKPERLDYMLRLADLSGIEVKDGAVDKTAMKETLEKVLKDVPELKGTSGAAAGGSGFSGQGGAGTGSGSLLTMEAIRAMSPKEVEARMTEIQAFLSKQGK